ncbi:hypothetical protein HDV01_001921, partial [Terramyces sp. JEL0728]
ADLDLAKFSVLTTEPSLTREVTFSMVSSQIKAVHVLAVVDQLQALSITFPLFPPTNWLKQPLTQPLVLLLETLLHLHGTTPTTVKSEIFAMLNKDPSLVEMATLTLSKLNGPTAKVLVSFLH